MSTSFILWAVMCGSGGCFHSRGLTSETKINKYIYIYIYIYILKELNKRNINGEAPGVFGTQRLPQRICTLSHCPWVARFKEYPRGFFAYPYAPGPNFVKLLSRKYCSENPMLSQKGWGTVPTTVWTDFRLVTSFC